MALAFITALGAALTIASSAIAGLRLHRLAIEHAPGIAILIPRDGGAIAGIIFGICSVAAWCWWP